MKMMEKSDNFEKRHKQFLEEKTCKAKNEKEKVAEINFINKIEKENKTFSILKKLDLSIERRNDYMKERLNKLKKKRKI